MPTVPPAPEQFWLLTGEVPSGPFTVAQVHAELAAGRATWQTPACPVGGSTWLPLVQTPGIGPSAPPQTAAGTRSPDTHPPSAPSAPAPSPDETAVAKGIEGVFAAKNPASASRPASDEAPSAVPSAPAGARLGDQPRASGETPQQKGPSQPNQSNRFWLLVGTEATGPYRAAHIRAKVQSGELPPDAKARRVGTEVWVPLTEAVGALPPPPAEPKTPVDGPAAPPSSPTPAATAGAPDTKAEHVGAAIGIVVVLLLIAGGVYGASWVWDQVRPPTATEVCKKIDEAKTAAEAKKYATPRMHPLLDAMFADKNALDPNDTSEWTQEVDGPRPDTRLVGFRGSFFPPEAGQRVSMEGHCKLLKSDGWKVDDMIVTGVEGASLPGPVSLVDEYRAPLTQPKAPATGGAARVWGKNGPPGSGSSFRPAVPQTPAWEKHPIGKVVASLRDAIGWGGIVVLVVLLAVGAAVREAWRKKSSTPS